MPSRFIIIDEHGSRRSGDEGYATIEEAERFAAVCAKGHPGRKFYVYALVSTTETPIGAAQVTRHV